MDQKSPHPQDPRTTRRPHGPGNRWELVWSHRDELLEIARRRSPSAEDAEDAVQEAMVRAVEDPEVPYGRVGPWLRKATVRLCADRRRQVARDSELSGVLPVTPVDPLTVEERACDRAEARWLAARGAELLPARQAQALRLRSRGLDVGQVAQHMGLGYRAAESLLARARRALRGVLAGSLSVAAAVWLFTRRFPHTGLARSAAATSTAATVVVVALALPAGPPGLADGRSPGGRGAATAPRAVGPAAEHPSPPATRTAPAPRAPTENPEASVASARPLSPGPRRVGRTAGNISRALPEELPGTAVVTETIVPGAPVPVPPSAAALAPAAAPRPDSSGLPFPEAPAILGAAGAAEQAAVSGREGSRRSRCGR